MIIPRMLPRPLRLFALAAAAAVLVVVGVAEVEVVGVERETPRVLLVVRRLLPIGDSLPVFLPVILGVQYTLETLGNRE